MSVESEILRIQHNIADTYAAVADKGGTVPTQPTSANLAAAVESIPAGGTLPPGGTTGQVLTKASDADSDVEWANSTGGAIEWGQIDGRPDLSTVASLNVKVITLRADLWSDKTQTITVDGILADETKQLIIPLPASASADAYNNAGVKCSAQGENELTFVCATTPTSNLAVNAFVIGGATVDPIYNYEWWSPQMTSDNTPAPYTVDASSIFQNRNPYLAFNGNLDNFWSSNNEVPAWILFDFGEKQVISGISFHPIYQQYAADTPRLFNVYGSDDGDNWVKLYEGANEDHPDQYIDFIFAQPFNYRYYKLADMYSFGTSTISIADIRFYKEATT